MTRLQSLAAILSFVNSFYEQCRNMVRDSVRLLRDNHGVYLNHRKEWDYAKKPKDDFLVQPYSSVRRALVMFVPNGDIRFGACFLFDFFHPDSPVSPSLIFGIVDPGSAGFGSVDRRAGWETLQDAEKERPSVTVSHDGPFTVLTGTAPKRIEKMVLVQIPLEQITDQALLEKLVVAPLAALLRGDRAGAAKLLDGLPTERWPLGLVRSPDDEDETEQA